jgi:hypothetical protein
MVAMSDITESLNSKPLTELADLIRAMRQEERKAGRHAWHRRLDIGDALIAAQAKVSSNWKRWLKENCFLSVRTALRYQQLARHRDEIEARIDQVDEFSLRDALRLISKSSGQSKAKKKEPAPDLIAAMQKATDAERTAMLLAFGFESFLRIMPSDWRPKLEARVVHLRADDGHPDLKVTQVLRTALSLIKTANMPGTSAAVSNANKHEALAALGQLNVLLLRGGFDLNDVTVNTAGMSSTKSRRRAA